MSKVPHPEPAQTISGRQVWLRLLRVIRAYERVGFRQVGVMRSYERGPDGGRHDGLLLEMLRGELADESPT